ncbi:MAG: amidophosphoribosyltransferase [Parcubacteria group bacterium]|nr:amidophosphoribosyltransferase [Parcubacteria group bacterium]
MCGVFGVIALAQVDPGQVMEYFALLGAGNQHRGHEWHGFACSNGKRLQIEKKPGLVSASLNNRRLVAELFDFGPQMMMGHTRYSTQGNSISINAQPHYLRMPGGTVALGSNGDIPDYTEARNYLERLGSEIISDNDAEVLLHRILFFSQNNPEKFPQGIANLMDRQPASYSAWLATRNRVHLFRDPWANRPLFWMRIGDFFFFSSEDCALYTILAQRAEDGKCDGEVEINQVLPGEIITIELHGEFECQQAVPPKPHLACCPFEWVYFSRPDSYIWVPVNGQRLVYRLIMQEGNGNDWTLKFEAATGVRQIASFRYDSGMKLGQEHPADHPSDGCVISIPSSGDKAAEGFSKTTGISYRGGLVRNPYVTRTFTDPGRTLRIAQAALKYSPLRGLYESHSHIYPVDDSAIFGTTLRRIVQMMRTAGAKHIHPRIACPPVRHHCNLGMDMSSKGDLVATKFGTVEGIQKHIGADSLGYLSLKGMQKVIGPELVPHCCFHCWDGNVRIG